MLLKRRAVPGFQARINDWLVPWLRLERRFGPPVGMSLLGGRARAMQRSLGRTDPVVTLRRLGGVARTAAMSRLWRYLARYRLRLACGHRVPGRGDRASR